MLRVRLRSGWAPLRTASAVEQIGKTICLRRAPHGPPSGDKASFLAACNDFGDSVHTEPNHRRLYDVRRALAHKYGLTGNNKQFVYTRSDTAPLLDATTTPGKTRVNLVAVWKYVDNMVAGIRVLHAAGDIADPDWIDGATGSRLSFEIRSLTTNDQVGPREDVRFPVLVSVSCSRFTVHESVS